MSSLQVDNIQSYNANPPVIKSSSGAEVGTFCRAWVNFNGTGTVAIRASFNVSSITDNGVGDYTMNFTTALVDANYSVSGLSRTPAVASGISLQPETYNSSSLRFATYNNQFNATDFTYAHVAIFR